MKNLQTYEDFINENIRPDQIEKMATDLAYSMPKHTAADSKGKFSAEQVLKAFKYFPDLKYVKDKNDIQNIVDKALAIINESTINEDSLNEGVWGDMMKGVKTGDNGPWSIVALEYGKVVGQSNDIKIRDLIPAKYEDMKRKYTKAKFHIEDAGGTTVWRTK